MKPVCWKKGTRTLCMVLLAAIALSVLGCVSSQTGSSADIPRMSIAELATRLDDSSVHILDVRHPYERRKSGLIIEGALPADPTTFTVPPGKYPKSDTFVLYCS